MQLDLATFQPVISAIAKAGVPFLEEGITAAVSAATGPGALIVGPVMNDIWPSINKAFGLAPDTEPTATAAAIAADPNAKDKLEAVSEQHKYSLNMLTQANEFSLAQQKQGFDFATVSQGQADAFNQHQEDAQVQLNTIQMQNPSLFIAGPRPAIMWGLGGLLMLFKGLPLFVWFLLCFGVHLPAPPDMDFTTMSLTAALLGVTIGARSFDKFFGTAAPQIGGGTSPATVITHQGAAAKRPGPVRRVIR